MLTACVVVGCGSTSSGGGKVTLNWWAYNEPSGSFTKAAKRCNKLANGRYIIKFNALGKDADTQRQQLVRRLAAKDSSIDLMSMDVVWTAEFARVSADELEELAADVGAADLPGGDGTQVVARLDAASRVRQGEPCEPFYDSAKIHLFDPDGGDSLLAGRSRDRDVEAQTNPGRATDPKPAAG